MRHGVDLIRARTGSIANYRVIPTTVLHYLIIDSDFTSPHSGLELILGFDKNLKIKSFQINV